jgi:hypothetical protein
LGLSTDPVIEIEMWKNIKMVQKLKFPSFKNAKRTLPTFKKLPRDINITVSEKKQVE